MTHHTAPAPDYDHWSRMARWEIQDAAALSLGLDALKRPEPAATEAASGFSQRLALIQNHVQAGRLPHHPEPAEFLAWAKANGVTVVKALSDAVAANGAKIRDWQEENSRLRAQVAELQAETSRSAKTTAADRELLPKEHISLLKLVFGMAVHKFGYRSGPGNTPSTRRIVDALAEHGVKIDEQTVLKWLRKAAEFVEREEQSRH